MKKTITESSLRAIIRRELRLQLDKKLNEASFRDNIPKEVRKVNEQYEIHYSDGIRARKKAKTINDAIKIANKLTKENGMKFVEIYKADDEFHSTTDDKFLVKWWGKNSYWDNMSKKDPKLLDKKLN